MAENKKIICSSIGLVKLNTKSKNKLAMNLSKHLRLSQNILKKTTPLQSRYTVGRKVSSISDSWTGIRALLTRAWEYSALYGSDIAMLSQSGILL